MRSSIINQPTLLIWDDEGEPPKGEWGSVLWRGFGVGDGSNVISVPQLVEKHSDALRTQYLAWIYEIGETSIMGKRVVDHLELRPGFSNWWMTLVAQKPNAFLSPYILDVFKCLAFENAILKIQKIDFIILISSNKMIASILRGYCQSTGIKYEWKRTQKINDPQSRIQLIHRSLPSPMQAIISFVRFVWKRWSFGGDARARVFAPFAEITIADILVHIDKQALSTGHFASNYWTTLVGALASSNVGSNWLHSYYEHEAVTSIKKAKFLISSFNKFSSGKLFHVLMDAELSLSVFVRALRDCFRLFWKSLQLTMIKRYFRPKDSVFNFWVLYKQDWYNSMRGPSALLNCLRLSLFEKIFRQLPCQRMGLYIQENQPWEMALIYSWKSAGHGWLIGVPHATVRYWDLRYFFDPRSYQRKINNDLPLPDQVAVNGPAALSTYLKGGYPGDQLIEVEALRYIHLAKGQQESVFEEKYTGVLRILICGGIMPAMNQQMMHWLEKAARALPPVTRYIVKSHPACVIRPGDYPSLTLEMTDATLSELFADCDVVFTSNSTSAAVDAHCGGIPVVHMHDGNTFNTSPLRGLKDMVYVTNPMELAEALINARQRECTVPEPYFWLDAKLPRWRQLLGLNPEHAE